jgi:hypothetical protein
LRPDRAEGNGSTDSTMGGLLEEVTESSNPAALTASSKVLRLDRIRPPDVRQNQSIFFIPSESAGDSPSPLTVLSPAAGSPAAGIQSTHSKLSSLWQPAGW